MTLHCLVYSVPKIAAFERLLIKFSSYSCISDKGAWSMALALSKLLANRKTWFSLLRRRRGGDVVVFAFH